MSIISDLIEKVINPDEAAQKVQQDPEALTELLAGALSHQDKERYNSYQVLMIISEEHPEILYPYWNQFKEMLESPNSNFQSIAIQILANLIKVDHKNQFESIFEGYFSILEGDKTVTAAFIAGNAWKIALAKPALQNKITDKLLDIDRIHCGKQKDLIKGHAIESFGHYFGEADTEDKKRILEFVERETHSQSPRTKKAAKQFLNNI